MSTTAANFDPAELWGFEASDTEETITARLLRSNGYIRSIAEDLAVDAEIPLGDALKIVVLTDLLSKFERIAHKHFRGF